MQQQFRIILVVLLLGATTFAVYSWYMVDRATVPGVPVPGPTNTSSPLDITFSLAGRSVTLTHGSTSIPVAPGSATQETFRVFGVPTRVDLDGDHDDDALFLVTQDGGGSGTFFYVVAAINESGSFVGTNALFLGDRIAPQTIDIENGTPVVNYADRNQGESFAVAPSVGKSVWIHYDPKMREIGEAVQNFEGEVDTTTMSLLQRWMWTGSVERGVTTTPKQAGKFVVTLGSDGQAGITTDCNGMGGSYTAQDGVMKFGPLMATQMYCEGAQEGDFAAMLSRVHGYRFSQKGDLELLFGEDGVATFQARGN